MEEMGCLVGLDYKDSKDDQETLDSLAKMVDPEVKVIQDIKEFLDLEVHQDVMVVQDKWVIEG